MPQPSPSSRLKVLLVSLAFPPKQDAEVLQVAKLYKYLTKLPDVDVHVVTSEETSRLSSIMAPKVRTDAGVTQCELYTNRYVNYAMLRFLPGLASRPDIKSQAILQVRAICKNLPWRPDIVLSRSYPISSALLGQAIAEHFDSPWVMQLSDPWSLSPLHPKGYAQGWNDRAEAKAFERASLVTFTSTRTMAKYERVYPDLADRMRYFPNTYDPDQNSPNPWVRNEKFRIVYTGTLGGSRRPDVLCEAMETLFTRQPQARDQVELVIAGHADRAIRAYLVTKGDYVDWRGPISFDQSMDLIRSADVLALIDNKPPAGPTSDDRYEFFPSKLLDYMLGHRPILGISEAESMTSTVIDTLGLGICFTHDQGDGLSAALEDKWQAWQTNQRQDFELNALDDSYDARASALRMYHELKELV